MQLPQNTSINNPVSNQKMPSVISQALTNTSTSDCQCCSNYQMNGSTSPRRFANAMHLVG
ncbi:hypothetical protein SynSYN20_00918 [Synechococcus sp. SYN20]|nr:hypothetical protein SynSYN20_00918 [Synechococcus sp. SYN20]